MRGWVDILLFFIDVKGRQKFMLLWQNKVYINKVTTLTAALTFAYKSEYNMLLHFVLSE